MDEYRVRVGVIVRKRPVKTYDALLGLPTEDAEDDGKVVYWGPGNHAWNEGVCECGGTLRWAEAGYVPWHRICDRCGSHWDMHPVTVYLRREVSADDAPAITSILDARLPQPGDKEWVAMDEQQRRLADRLLKRRNVCPEDELAEVDQSLIAILSHYRQDRDDPMRRLETREHDAPEAQRVISLIRPEHITPEAIEHGAVYGGWARRARFYSG